MFNGGFILGFATLPGPFNCNNLLFSGLTFDFDLDLDLLLSKDNVVVGFSANGCFLGSGFFAFGFNGHVAFDVPDDPHSEHLPAPN